MSTIYQKPTQIIQPFMFGHAESKATCLWIEGLEKLKPTNIVQPNMITFASGKKCLHFIIIVQAYLKKKEEKQGQKHLLELLTQWQLNG